VILPLLTGFLSYSHVQPLDVRYEVLLGCTCSRRGAAGVVPFGKLMHLFYAFPIDTSRRAMQARGCSMSVDAAAFQGFREKAGSSARRRPRRFPDVRVDRRRRLQASPRRRQATYLETCIHCACVRRPVISTRRPVTAGTRDLQVDLLRRYYRRELAPMAGCAAGHARHHREGPEDWQELVYDSCTQSGAAT